MVASGSGVPAKFPRAIRVAPGSLPAEAGSRRAEDVHLRTYFWEGRESTPEITRIAMTRRRGRAPVDDCFEFAEGTGTRGERSGTDIERQPTEEIL